jgi:hypothetical protein
MKIGPSLFLLALLLVGCSKKPDPATGRMSEFLVNWLKQHGETNVVVDASGVGIAGNETRLGASIYNSQSSETDSSVELEFKVKLPSGGPIVEYVAGTGSTQEKAMGQALENFVLTTMHVIYKAFMNPADEHQRAKSVVIAGKPRELIAGNMIQFGVQGNGGAIDLGAMSAQVQDIVMAQPLGPGPHWIKIVYSQDSSKPMIVSATLDNRDANEMTSAVQNLKWPERNDFYMVKQFIIIK